MLKRNLLLAAVAAGSLVTAGAGAYAQATAPQAAATAARPMDAAERKRAVEELAKDLEDRFVFPEVGVKYAAMLRANLASGAYENLTDPTAFSQKVTADLQAVSPDRHLRLAPEEAFAAPRRAMSSGSGLETLEEAKMIGDVAYLRFNMFSNDPAVVRRARQFLLDHADAKAVILDARPNRGGSLAVMDAVLPLLFGETATLVRMDTRVGVPSPMQAGATLLRQASPPTVLRLDHIVRPDTVERRLQRVPVFYLTSGRTASAAEHLALAFKHTGRATLVGEKTYGAGHYGGVGPVGERFAAFIPVGRTYDPDTGQGWEEVGVAPDVAVPADKALDEALARAQAAGARI